MICPKCGHSFGRKETLTAAVLRLHKKGKSNQKIYEALKDTWFANYSSRCVALNSIRVIIFRNGARRKKK